jgi:hypothetical protein
MFKDGQGESSGACAVCVVLTDTDGVYHLSVANLGGPSVFLGFGGGSGVVTPMCPCTCSYMLFPRLAYVCEGVSMSADCRAVVARKDGPKFTCISLTKDHRATVQSVSCAHTTHALTHSIAACARTC